MIRFLRLNRLIQKAYKFGNLFGMKANNVHILSAIAFENKALRRILGINWKDRISNNKKK